jgi:hypothetical protein
VGYCVNVRTARSDVEAWSSTRLPFEPKGWLLDFRRELAQACRELTAAPWQVLHAVYSSTDRRPVDIENVLTYNLGLGAIRAAVQHGLILERAYTAVDDTDHTHHYRYRLADPGQPWTHWSVDKPLASVEFTAPAEAFRKPTAGRWWLATRRAGLTAHAQTSTVPDRLALRVLVSPPENWRGSLARLLKPLADGLIAAMHAHEGPLDPALLERAPAINPDLTRDEFHALLLAPTTAPLGRVRLAVPWGATLQWLPADDRIVALDIRLTADGKPGTVIAEALTAVAA